MLLHSQLVQSSSAAVVTLHPPGDDLPDVSGVNLYLYRVMESPFLKNQPWPGDRSTPPSPQSALCLELFYLLTPLGKKPADDAFNQGDDAHTMLGVAMRTLQDHPVLNHVHIPGFDADAVLPRFLQDSFERIKITLLPTTIDDLSKIWATINKPYRLSVAYDVSLVQIAPAAPPPSGRGIVLTTGLQVIAIAPPRLASLTPSRGALAHIAASAVVPNDLIIDGLGMSFPGAAPLARVGGRIAAIKTVPAPADQRIVVTLPVSLDAGPQADVTVTLNGRTSLPLTFTVTPWIASITPVRTALGVPNSQLVLSGSGFTATPQAVRFELATPPPPASPPVPVLVTVNTFAPGGTDSLATVTLPSSLVNGTYNVRLVLAGAPGSASNTRPLEVIPLITPPIGLAVVPSGLKQVHQLTINGARLNGDDVRVLVDGAGHHIGQNLNAATLVLTLGRQLSPGPHTIAVQVDGHTSHDVPLVT